MACFAIEVERGVGIENFTLLVDHAVEGAQTGLGGISIEMEGELKSDSREFCRLLQNDPERRFAVRWEGNSCFTGEQKNIARHE